MTFKARISGTQLYHHIYAWGNDRHPIFKKGKHYCRYLKLLKEYSLYFKIDVIAYALMEWHVHLFIYDLNNRISDFMRHLHGDYAIFYNRDTKRVGHVFGERFNNKIIQPNNYGLWLTRYIHRQAVEAGLVNDPKDYFWTSYRVYIGLEKENTFLKPDVILRQFGDGSVAYSNYRDFVMANADGPIDWKKTKQMIIGDKYFIEDVQAIGVEGMVENGKIEIEDLVIKELGLDISILLKPEGISQRRLRQGVIIRLAKEYGYSKSEIARAFKMSIMAITKILRK